MRRGTLTIAAMAAALAAVALWPAASSAQFGLKQFEVRYLDAEDNPERQAGSHPFAMETFFEVNSSPGPGGAPFVDGGDIKDLVIEQLRGLIGDATAVPRCSTLEFADFAGGIPACPDETAVGVVGSIITEPDNALPAAVFNLTPPPGVAVRLGFVTSEVPLVIDVGIKTAPEHNVVADVSNIPQPLTVFGSVFQLWGVPADERHDFARGSCIRSAATNPDELIIEGRLNLKEDSKNTCPAEVPEEKPLLTLPRTCDSSLATAYRLAPWSDPAAWVGGSALTPPFTGCGKEKVPFDPDVSSRATVNSAETGSGLDFEIDFLDEVDPVRNGLVEPDGIAGSDIKETVVTMPEGVTVNPSIAEGLEVCEPDDLDDETLAARFGDGCPAGSKIGTVSVDTPLVGEQITGNVFIAAPDDPDDPGPENPFDSLIAFYIVLKNTNLGVLVKVPAKVEPDPRTGQLITTATDLPQIPFERFRFHFREGQRAPLITPPGCGTYETEVEFVPWARPGETITERASFEIDRGVGGGSCPSGSLPFAPGFAAGAANNAAGAHSPFLLRLTRPDGHQDLTRFDAVLPPGVVARLAGLSWCSAAQIALARAKSGKAELANPSCPASSRIGGVLAGAGVGSSLTYVPGSVYLSGPFAGAPLSVIGVVPAVAGPFDAGTVVTRQALRVDPVSAAVSVDGALSDPIPHILRGIPLKVRDIRVSVDRPAFTLNPTSCDPSRVWGGLWGGGDHPFSRADDAPVVLSNHFQAAGCARLGFKPRLAIKLRGGVKRGAHPALRAHVRPRPDDANFSRAVVTLPRSAFLDQAHIRTICTRVQFAAPPGHGTHCPPGARYGFARAWSPLLDAPAQGPVYLRSSDNQLPDLVVALKGPPSAPVDFELSARIDSVKGGIRSTFAAIPDVPVSRFILDMQGGKKGLIVNSRHLCHKPKRNRARSSLRGQNGKISRTRPRVIAAKCQKRRKAKRKRGGRSAARVSRAGAVKRVALSGARKLR